MARPLLDRVRPVTSVTPSDGPVTERVIMAARRLSRLQRRILQSLMAQYQRTQGGTSLAHVDLVQGLRGDKSNISHSLRTMESRGLIAISRTPGGKADSVDLTPEGRKLASEFE